MDSEESKNGMPNGVPLPDENTEITPIDFQIERVEKGHFKKGVSGNPSGKPKGVGTKKTERLKILMDGALSEMWPKYMKTLSSLEGREFAQEYRALMEFRMPRLARLDSTTVSLQQNRKQQTIKIGDTEFIIN